MFHSGQDVGASLLPRVRIGLPASSAPGLNAQTGNRELAACSRVLAPARRAETLDEQSLAVRWGLRRRH
jgi:hypothetical protein